MRREQAPADVMRLAGTDQAARRILAHAVNLACGNIDELSDEDYATLAPGFTRNHHLDCLCRGFVRYVDRYRNQTGFRDFVGEQIVATLFQLTTGCLPCERCQKDALTPADIQPRAAGWVDCDAHAADRLSFEAFA